MTTTPSHPDPDVVIYHGGCWDGFASAMVACRAVVLDSVGHHPAPTLVPAHYGMDMPDVKGMHVLVADFSFPPPQMLDLAQRAESVVWIDHHASAIDAMTEGDLEAFADFGGTAILDTGRSGAALTYKWFHPDARYGIDCHGPIDTPPLVAYIEDRDLWAKQLPDHDAVAMWIRSHEMTPQAWDAMIVTRPGQMASEGAAMSVYHSRLVANAARSAFWAEFPDTDDEITMPLAACSYDLGSDVAQRLIEITGSPVAGYVLHNAHGQIQYGLRSAAGFDCSAIAKVYGGGGHPQASGFTGDKAMHRWRRPVSDEFGAVCGLLLG